MKQMVTSVVGIVVAQLAIAGMQLLWWGGLLLMLSDSPWTGFSMVLGAFPFGTGMLALLWWMSDGRTRRRWAGKMGRGADGG